MIECGEVFDCGGNAGLGADIGFYAVKILCVCVYPSCNGIRIVGVGCGCYLSVCASPTIGLFNNITINAGVGGASGNSNRRCLPE